MTIENTGSGSISLSDISISIMLDNTDTLVFDCYHAGMSSSSGQYSEVNGTSGEFESDRCVITAGSSGNLAGGSTLTINFAIHRSDWQNLGFSVGQDGIVIGD